MNYPYANIFHELLTQGGLITQKFVISYMSVFLQCYGSIIVCVMHVEQDY